jgi:hypothetical protein
MSSKDALADLDSRIQSLEDGPVKKYFYITASNNFVWYSISVIGTQITLQGSNGNSATSELHLGVTPEGVLSCVATDDVEGSPYTLTELYVTRSIGGTFTASVPLTGAILLEALESFDNHLNPGFNNDWNSAQVLDSGESCAVKISVLTDLIADNSRTLNVTLTATGENAYTNVTRVTLQLNPDFSD